MLVAAKRLLETTRQAKLRFGRRFAPFSLPSWARAGANPLRICIVGGGISGLTTGWLLDKLGHEVLVFEARGRPGGRIYTFRPSSHPDIYAEVGAARISDEHQRTLHWIHQFSLDLEPMYPLTGRLVRLDKNCRQLGPDIAGMSTYRVHHLISEGADWSRQHNNFLYSVRDLVSESLTKPNWFRIAGGNAKLPIAIATDLGDRLMLRTRVVAVGQTSDHTHVTYEANGVSGTDTFDRVIVAAPLSTLNRIEFTPLLSDFKQDLVANSRQQSSIRIFVQLRDRSWMQGAVCGYGTTDTGYEVWHPTFSSRSNRCILVLYAQGPSAKRLTELDQEGRTRHAISVLNQMYPGVESLCEHATAYCWDEDPWARGAQSLLKKEDNVQWEEVRRPEGRIHFAGEYTTGGWIDDALESAHRVVGEICDMR